MKANYDLALIMKKTVYQDGNIELVPLEVLEGVYDEVNEAFIDLDGTPYYHVISNPDSIGFIYRDNIDNYKKNYPYLSTSRLKAMMLKSARKSVYLYCFAKKNDTLIPVILYSNEQLNEPKLLLDGDM